jgi:hypothetical protein
MANLHNFVHFAQILSENSVNFAELLIEVLNYAGGSYFMHQLKQQLFDASRDIIASFNAKCNSKEARQEFLYGAIKTCMQDRSQSLRLFDELHTRCGSPELNEHINAFSMSIYHKEILTLVDKNQGFHFNASHTTVEKIESFSIRDTRLKMKEIAPNLYGIVQRQLDSSDSKHRAGHWTEEDMQDFEDGLIASTFDVEDEIAEDNKDKNEGISISKQDRSAFRQQKQRDIVCARS